MAELACWLLVATYVVLTAVRVVLARRTWRPPEAAASPGAVVVLQPILSGDPHLADDLAANLANHPGVHFRWLVDTSDAEGLRITHRLAGAANQLVEVQEFPPAPEDANPKVFKLARAVEADDELVAVLDDDTVLPPGSLARARTALEGADLVTGLPFYASGGSLWSRLVAAFVNGNALLTYLPLTAFGSPVTINGMFYLTSRDALQRAGGFAGIEGLVCDDHELARAYRSCGLRIAQTAIPHPVRTTVPDARGYLRLMRRWMGLHPPAAALRRAAVDRPAGRPADSAAARHDPGLPGGRCLDAGRGHGRRAGGQGAGHRSPAPAPAGDDRAGRLGGSGGAGRPPPAAARARRGGAPRTHHLARPCHGAGPFRQGEGRVVTGRAVASGSR